MHDAENRREVRSVREALLPWYDAQRRDLPWRHDATPYRVWVSEVMLQQTRVEAVLEHYPRFLGLFPDIPALAAAEVDQVLAAWSGLGYYRRARLLHRGARHVVEVHGGQLPSDPVALRKVPGIGPYTAGALLSIAFGQPAPLVDGNVERVLARWRAWRGDPRRAPLKGRLWQLAEALVPEDRPGDFNQALMELGATVCKPRNPACPTCPLRPSCQALDQGVVLELPELAARKPTREVTLAAALVRREGRVLMWRRPESESLMPGLWELPTVEVQGDEDPRPALVEAIRARTGLAADLGLVRAEVRHGILDRRITLRGYRGEARGRSPRRQDVGWIEDEGIAQLGVSSMYLKLLAADGRAQAQLPLGG